MIMMGVFFSKHFCQHSEKFAVKFHDFKFLRYVCMVSVYHLCFKSCTQQPMLTVAQAMHEQKHGGSDVAHHRKGCGVLCTRGSISQYEWFILKEKVKSLSGSTPTLQPPMWTEGEHLHMPKWVWWWWHGGKSKAARLQNPLWSSPPLSMHTGTHQKGN